MVFAELISDFWFQTFGQSDNLKSIKFIPKERKYMKNQASKILKNSRSVEVNCQIN